MATETSAKSAMGGSVLEILAAVGAVVLAILGLAEVAPWDMAGIATLLVGCALLMESAAVLSRFRAAARFRRERGERAQIGSGAFIEILGGSAGIVLGAFALAGFAPATLIPIATIVFGGALLLGSAGTARFHGEEAGVEHDRMAEKAERGGRAASGMELLAGIAAITLGILALLDFAPITFSLIALLAVGASLLLSGAAITAEVGRVARPHHHARS